jgi:hypothetical protein
MAFFEKDDPSKVDTAKPRQMQKRRTQPGSGLEFRISVFAARRCPGPRVGGMRSGARGLRRLRKGLRIEGQRKGFGKAEERSLKNV